ncbi:matrixin family metalloprotease [Microbacterium rhizophilus]|uniref:matrixin family metalloprotease n=1 Tax=Microbacterium rhizophilus TaxID=3138934 RepID=UPI0031F0BD1B
MRRILALAAIAALTAAAVPAAAAADTAPSCPTAVAGQHSVAAEAADGLDALSCDTITTVSEDGVGAVIPDPGYGVTAIALDEDGTETALTVTTDEEGTVDVETEDHAASAATATAAAATAATITRCSDTSHVLAGTRWTAKPTFAVNSTERRPSNIKEADWELVIGDALRTITTGANQCGKTVSLSSAGATTWNKTGDSNISSTNTCTASDGVSVVDFGALSSSLVGLTCVWFTIQTVTDKINAADIRMDTSTRSWVTSVGSCTGDKFDLRSALTHEFGHAFGLSHAAERGADDLTMSPTLYPCNSSARYLGLGDLQGMLALYPAS